MKGRMDLGPALKRIRKGAARGLRTAAEDLAGESQRLVPIEEGTLERSVIVDVDDDALVATVGYDTPYAVRQHEDLDARHDPGRQAKYLEEPALGMRGTFPKIVAREIERELR